MKGEVARWENFMGKFERVNKGLRLIVWLIVQGMQDEIEFGKREIMHRAKNRKSRKSLKDGCEIP